MTSGHSDRWLSGYYISFEETGCFPVDVILSAVARAGKAYHSTEDWGEASQPYEPGIHRGDCCLEWIQNAAIDAAAAFERAREQGRAEERERAKLIVSEVWGSLSLSEICRGHESILERVERRLEAE